MIIELSSAATMNKIIFVIIIVQKYAVFHVEIQLNPKMHIEKNIDAIILIINITTVATNVTFVIGRVASLYADNP